MASSAELRDTMLRYIHSSEHPDLQVYRRDIADDNMHEVWTWRTRHFCDLGNFYGKRVLEVGCGFGWDAVGLAIVGKNDVVASDILPSMVDGMTQCLDGMKAKGESLSVTPLQGDVCRLDLPDASFDGIFSTEAIEHVHDLGEMFDNCWRLLKPGGTLLLVNDSNKYSPESRAHSWGAWQERDDSWEHANWLRDEVRPVEHANAKPYGVMREEHIRKIAPELSDGDVAKLRAGTAGMIYREIDQALADFKRDGTVPTRDEYRWCRNPETGEYSERLLDPFELEDMLKARGFKVRLRHLFRKFPYRLLNETGLRAVQKRVFNIRPHFVLVAKKPA
jgi:ubiquinone/menaquinone biosynthesis C-methylase UbiE